MNPHGARGFPLRFPPAPREVRLKPGAVAGVLWGRVVTIPFLLVGLFLVFVTLQTPLTTAFGSDAVGRVEQVTPHRGRGRAGPHPDPRRFDLVFTYQHPGDAPQPGNGLIDTGGAKPPTVGQALPIRVLRIGEIHLTELRAGNPGASGSCCVGLFVFVWCGFAVLFALAAWWGPVAASALVRDGRAVAGTVIGKRRRSTGRSGRYEILYQFTTAEHTTQSAVQWVGTNAYGSFWEGQTVTVIYDERRPTRSTIYEASDYEVTQ